MKALKYPLTVRDNDGKEWELTDYNKYSNGDEFVTFYGDNGNIYTDMRIGSHCQWVEAEQSGISEQLKNCSTCKFNDDCTDYGMYQCVRCIGDDPPSRWTLK